MAYTNAQLVAAYTAIADAPPSDLARAALEALAARTRGGELTEAAALAMVLARADIVTAVVGEILRFFNGRPPRRIDLADVAETIAARADAGGASAENQLMGFAAELGLGQGRQAFAGAYAGMDYPAFVAAAYEVLIGVEEARAAGFDPAAAIADTAGRAQGFAGLLRDRGVVAQGVVPADEALAVKAATVGYLVCEAIKWDFGLCARRANDQALGLAGGN
jgi:hypothetical protein